ncbi:TetR/AcrR family transcriptional regulator [Nakamurella flavida]|uniref:TetR/AcrR family transcriptional regulator n=1 Tax=Nakamurella flavida TaxID=363630 RepID=A0A939C7K5_9ACTN|nr:TetR/AcrR family transcriptional regulator [Nakamurella flavida]MBM9478262.1 TetR/AcrR family transcriptional regulator [Nakamurella flavida]MDP9777567.1 AcrR family transcriptional regulator [Nakamurella flavida]
MPRQDRAPRVRLDPAERRAAILVAARHTFLASGYPRATVAAIAETAGASEALVYRYFPGKAELYTAVVRAALDDLAADRSRALAALPPGSSARDAVRAAVLVLLDHLERRTGAGVPLVDTAGEPPAVVALRRDAWAELVEVVREQLRPGEGSRHDWALRGWVGFVEAVGARWQAAGCPPDERWPLLDAALGALEGALGDWAA